MMLVLAYLILGLSFWGQLKLLSSRVNFSQAHHAVYLWFLFTVGLGLAYLLYYPMGLALSLGIFLSGCYWAWRFRAEFRTDSLKMPILLLVGLVYLGLASLKPYSGNFVDHLQTLYFDIANDNVIPRILSETLRYGRELKFPNPEWQFSDRTPLQSFAYLALSFYTDTKTYQAAGMLFQLLWIPALFHWLSRRLRLNSHQSAWVVLMVLSSGVIYFNSLYVWPKLLSAALFLWALSDFQVAVESDLKDTRSLRWAAVGFSLSFLAHSGIVFAFPLILVPGSKVCRLTRWNWVALVKAAALSVVVLIPWLIYSKVIDPPGDALLRLHFAGTLGRKDLGLVEFLQLRYGLLNWEQILGARISNIQHIVWPRSGTWPEDLRALRRFEFDHLVGALNLAWLGLMASLFDRSIRRWTIGLIGAGVIWALSFYHPEQTTVVHCSFGVLLVGMAIGYVYLSQRLSTRVKWTLLGFKVVWLVIVWNPWL